MTDSLRVRELPRVPCYKIGENYSVRYERNGVTIEATARHTWEAEAIRNSLSAHNPVIIETMTGIDVTPAPAMERNA